MQRRVAAVVGGGRPPLQVQLNSAQQRSSDAKRPLTSSQQPHVDTASANSAAHSAATPHPQPALCYSAVRVRLFVRLCGCSVAAAAASDGRLAAAEAARGKRQAARQQRAYTTQRSHSAPSARSTVFLHPLRADARGCCCVSLFAVRATREWAERLQVADAVDAAKRRARASGGGGADGRSAAAAPLRLSHRASPSTAAAASPQLGSVAAAVASAASSDGREAKTKAVALQQAMQRAQQNDGERQAQVSCPRLASAASSRACHAQTFLCGALRFAVVGGAQRLAARTGGGSSGAAHRADSHRHTQAAAQPAAATTTALSAGYEQQQQRHSEDPIAAFSAAAAVSPSAPCSVFPLRAATVQRASSAHQHALKQPTCGDSRDEEICLPCPSPLLCVCAVLCVLCVCVCVCACACVLAGRVRVRCASGSCILV